MKAGFAEVDITPPIGSEKIGWIKKIVCNEVLDPLYVRTAVFESEGSRVGFVQCDTLFTSRDLTKRIRDGISASCGFPGEAVMVSATHNHAGPAVMSCGEVECDEDYVKTLIYKCVRSFDAALEAMEDVEFGFASVSESDVSFNRRTVMRDGTVKTHFQLCEPDTLCLEGTIDPEVGVLAARRPGGELLGCIVDFTCHPTDHGGSEEFSAGFPGVVANLMKRAGCPVTVYQNGAQGNIATNGSEGIPPLPKEETGAILAADVQEAIEKISFSADCEIGCISREIKLPYREPTEEQIKGTAVGAQRFVDPTIYDKYTGELAEMIRREKTRTTELQVIRIGDVLYASLPGEFFVELGLQVKMAAHPLRAQMVGLGNDHIGYVPTKIAFTRGGYETTFLSSSCMAPETGDLVVEAVIEMINELAGK